MADKSAATIAKSAYADYLVHEGGLCNCCREFIRQSLTGYMPYAMLLSEVSKLKGRHKIPLPNKGADP